MKVLVTGGGGQLARALGEARPDKVELVARTRAELDVADRAALEGLLGKGGGFDTVVNCAAYTAVDRAEEEQSEAMRINGAAVQGLAELAAQHGARLVQVSTDFVFDGQKGRPYRVEDEARPISAYGRSKLEGERAALAFPENLVIRTAWLYGLEGRNFVVSMLDRMRAGQALRVVTDQVGTPTHAASLARAVWKLVEGGASGIHHFTDAGVASWYDLAVAIQEEALALELLARPVPVAPIATGDYPTAARRPAFSVLDKSATWAMLGEPARHWRVELREMLSSLRERVHG